jgi:phage gpG-like protein
MAQGIARAMDKQNEETVGYIQRAYLTGPSPQKLGVVTNRLRSSVHPSVAVIEGNTVSSTIGTNVEYAAAHEHGFTGNVTVRSHTRRIFGSKSSGGTRVVDTVAEFNTKTGRISRLRKKKAKYQTSSVTVRSFTRHMKMPARPFLAPGLKDLAPNYGQVVSEAIRLAWSGGRG